MLFEQHLVVFGARVVGLGVAPAVHQVAAQAAVAARVRRCFGGGGAVIEYPQLATAADAEHDLVQIRVVVDRVHMVPERVDLPAALDRTVRIDQFRVIRDHAVVVLGGVEVLDQVVPDVPLPDDVAAAAARGRDLDDGVRQHIVVALDIRVEQVRVEAGRKDLGVGLLLNHQHQDVAVGQHLDVVVRHVVVGGPIEFPHEVAVPVVLLDAAAFAAARGPGVREARPHQVPILLQVDRLTRFVGARRP